MPHDLSIIQPGSPLSTGDLEPGWITNQVTAGSCMAAAAPLQLSRTSVSAKLLKPGDGTTGLFQEITVVNWNDPDGRYFDAPAAHSIEGLGLTCDNPVALGF